MTTRKGLLVLFVLVNFLLGYVFSYVFLASIGIGFFLGSSLAQRIAFVIAMAAMLIYFILMVLLNYILIRWLLKEKWFVWVGVALVLFIAAIYFFNLQYSFKISLSRGC